jgi:hypothetical protein
MFYTRNIRQYKVMLKFKLSFKKCILQSINIILHLNLQKKSLKIRYIEFLLINFSLQLSYLIKKKKKKKKNDEL